MPTGVYERKPRVARVVFRCETCGANREVVPSMAAKISGKYCSQACAAFVKRDQNLDSKTCAHCGSTINIRRRSTRKFCSSACAGQSRRVPGAKWRDPEQIKAYMSEYNRNNRERENERRRVWNSENVESRKAIAKSSAHRRRVRDAGKTNLRQAVMDDGRVTPADIMSLYVKAQNRCVYCARRTRSFTIDHVTPISRGGLHTKDNLIPCCKSCNSSKGAKDEADWLFDKFGSEGVSRALIFLERDEIDLRLYEVADV